MIFYAAETFGKSIACSHVFSKRVKFDMKSPADNQRLIEGSGHISVVLILNFDACLLSIIGVSVMHKSATN